ncbi:MULTISPECIES: hypothetical protein [unclassified Micromonospora]|uniref:hypothetical protein n=1 Tax=unclassified Micromonospora TaxID=2617518 RepID=UPI00332F9061
MRPEQIHERFLGRRIHGRARDDIDIAGHDDGPGTRRHMLRHRKNTGHLRPIRSLGLAPSRRRVHQPNGEPDQSGEYSDAAKATKRTRQKHHTSTPAIRLALGLGIHPGVAPTERERREG